MANQLTGQVNVDRQAGEGRLDATIRWGSRPNETTDVGKDTGSGGQPAVSIRSDITWPQ